MQHRKRWRWLFWFVLVFTTIVIVLSFLANFVESKSSVLPTTLNGNIRGLIGELLVHYRDKGCFPEKLEMLGDIHDAPSRYFDPYLYNRGPLQYRRVVSEASEQCMISISRLPVPAVVLEVTPESEWPKVIFTSEFEKLRETLKAEGAGKKLPPNAPFPDYIIFALQRISGTIIDLVVPYKEEVLTTKD